MPKPAPAQPSAIGLRAVKLLKGLSTGALEALARECIWRRYQAEQQVISREAREERDVYLIVAGRVRVTAYSASGRQVTFRDIGAGDLFGELAALDNGPRSADVVALEETLLASMSPAAFHDLLNEHGTVRERVMQTLAASVRDLTERVFELSTLGVENRVHAELLRLAYIAGVAGNASCIEPAPKHSEIASRVSTNREQVTRVLSALAKQGLVERDGEALVVPDVARLARMVAEVRSCV